MQLLSSCFTPQTIANEKAQSEKGLTPLHVAAREGQVEVIKALIEAHANNGQTALNLALNDPRAVSILLHFGADPLSITNPGSELKPEVVELLRRARNTKRLNLKLSH